jgi:putative peptidoglycan lipid II flippase
MIKRFLNSQAKTVTFAAVILGFSTFISRVLGLVRDRLLASKFGASAELDIYFSAFRIPDFVFAILITGGITAIFLPVFAEYFKRDEKEAWNLASNVLNCFLLMLVLLCGLLAIFTPQLLRFIVPGFQPEQKDLAIALSRIMFLSPILLGLSSVFSGILQYFNRFLAYSLAPIFYNLGLIFGILFFAPALGLPGLALGVVFGAFLHLVLQIPVAFVAGFKYRPIINFKYPGLLKMFKLMIPRTFGAAVSQINLMVIISIASTLAVGSITIFNFAHNFQGLPVGIIGSSFAVAVFPALARAWASGAREEFLDNFSAVARQIIFLIIPLSLLMFFMRFQTISLILGSGQFGAAEIRLTAAVLGVFCLGIFACTLIPFLARAFYSFQDTKTPVFIGIFSIAVNLALCFLFIDLLKSSNAFSNLIVKLLDLQGIQDIAIVGLPLAYIVSTFFQFALLLVFLKRRVGDLRLKEIGRSFGKVALASVLMTAAVFLSFRLANCFLDSQIFSGLLVSTVLALVLGLAVYLLAAYFLKSLELRMFWHSLLKQFK